jgi:hypothetical protein
MKCFENCYVVAHARSEVECEAIDVGCASKADFIFPGPLPDETPLGLSSFSQSHPLSLNYHCI